MKEQQMQGKVEENNLTCGSGDLRKRIEEFGTRVRKKCIRRKNHSVIESSYHEPIPPEEIKPGTISITRRFVDIMYFGSPDDQMRGVKFIRKLLASPHPLIDEVMQAGLLPILVSLLKSQSDLMQYEAAWSLTNILSGSSLHVRYVVEAGAVEYFVKLLKSSNEEVQEQCAWALGNIAGDMDDFRAYVLDQGSMLALLNMMESTATLKLLQTGAWAVCNLCFNNPDFKNVAPAIPVLSGYLHHENMDFLYNCTLALAHLSDGNERIQPIINSNVVPSVIKLLASDKECLMQHLLKIAVNVSMGNRTQLDCLMKYDILQPMKRHLDSRKESYRYKATCVVANMTGGNTEHIEYVIRNTCVISKVLSSIGTDTERVLKQAVFTLRNISSGGNEEQVLYLTDKCVVNKLCYSLAIPNASIVLAALVCLGNLLDLGERRVAKQGAYNEVAVDIEECRGLENIEELQSHSNQEIYHKAYEIMENHFSTEEQTIMERPKF